MISLTEGLSWAEREDGDLTVIEVKPFFDGSGLCSIYDECLRFPPGRKPRR